MHSLKSKLVVTISLLIVVLFALASALFVNEKQKEFTQDIFKNASSFGELTAPQIVINYNLYLAQKSFIYFNREIAGTFEKFPDLSKVEVISYAGELVYDSAMEKEKQYEGPARMVSDDVLKQQVQARHPSVFTLDTKRTVYLAKDEQGQFLFVDENEKPVKPLAPDEKIKYLVQPGSNDFAVVYFVSYDSLRERIFQTILRGIMLAAFGVGIGILMAFVYASRITKPIQSLTYGAGVIAHGDFSYRVDVKTKDEIQVLATAFNSMAQDLEISTKAMVYKERVAKELELAAKIQRELLPKNIPQMPSLDIAAGLIPAEEIGGDCYDFIRVDEQKLLMYLGDVTGHGVPSGIVVAIANALIYNYATEPDLTKLIIDVNKILKAKTSTNMFMTMVALRWDELTKNLSYVSAGHEQMIHYKKATNEIVLTPAGGLALGMFPDISKHIREVVVDFQPGDVLVIYSDGIPECWRNETEMYGIERFKKAVASFADLRTALGIRNAIMADVKGFAGKWKQIDDITLVVLKHLG